jgi:hypothetical protein
MGEHDLSRISCAENCNRVEVKKELWGAVKICRSWADPIKKWKSWNRLLVSAADNGLEE